MTRKGHLRGGELQCFVVSNSSTEFLNNLWVNALSAPRWFPTFFPRLSPPSIRCLLSSCLIFFLVIWVIMSSLFRIIFFSILFFLSPSWTLGSEMKKWHRSLKWRRLWPSPQGATKLLSDLTTVQLQEIMLTLPQNLLFFNLFTMHMSPRKEKLHFQGFFLLVRIASVLTNK